MERKGQPMDEFSELVHQVIIGEKKYQLKRVAHNLGYKYAAYYARLNKRVAFKAAEIRALVGEVPDLRLISYLLEKTDYIAVNSMAVPENPDEEDISDGVQELVVQAADVLKAVRSALDDQKIDHQENRKIMDEIDEVERTLALLSLRLSTK